MMYELDPKDVNGRQPWWWYVSMILALLFVISMGNFMSSCSPQRWFLVNSNGIATYNRHTGQLEIMWEWNENPNNSAAKGKEKDTLDVQKGY